MKHDSVLERGQASIVRDRADGNQPVMSAAARNTRPAARTGRWLAWGQLLGILTGAIGWWLPWALHPSGAAALVLLGLDLGEFFKFTSVWQGGELQWERQIFYLPPVLASLALATLIAQRPPRPPWLLVILAAFLATVVLPPYPYTPEILFAAEFQFQTWSALVALLAVTAALVLPAILRLPRSALLLIRVMLGLAGLALPLWAFWRVKLILDGLYGRPIVVGPGLYVTTGGFALVALTALYALAQPARVAVLRRATTATSSAAEQAQ